MKCPEIFIYLDEHISFMCPVVLKRQRKGAEENILFIIGIVMGVVVIGLCLIGVAMILL